MTLDCEFPLPLLNMLRAIVEKKRVKLWRKIYAKKQTFLLDDRGIYFVYV
jgi:F0F1-type ATP synthase delta subunit